jgi:putative membrane protein
MSYRAPRRILLGLGVVALSIGAGSLAHAQHSNHRRSAWDEQWLMSSIAGDRFEVAGGKLAGAKATNAGVRALGARLVKDHSKSLEDAIKLAKRLGVDVPDSPSPSQQWELDTVASFSGNAFDRRYADLELQDHKQDIEEAKAEITKGTNRSVRDEARKDLPVLRRHLKLSRAALKAAGG